MHQCSILKAMLSLVASFLSVTHKCCLAPKVYLLSVFGIFAQGQCESAPHVFFAQGPCDFVLYVLVCKPAAPRGPESQEFAAGPPGAKMQGKSAGAP